MFIYMMTCSFHHFETRISAAAQATKHLASTFPYTSTCARAHTYTHTLLPQALSALTCSSYSVCFARCQICINHEDKSTRQWEKGNTPQPRPTRRIPPHEGQGHQVRLGVSLRVDLVTRSHRLVAFLSAPLPSHLRPTPLFLDGCFCVLRPSLFPCSWFSPALSLSLQAGFNLTPWALVTRWGAEQPQRNSLGSTLQGPLSVR